MKLWSKELYYEIMKSGLTLRFISNLYKLYWQTKPLTLFPSIIVFNAWADLAKAIFLSEVVHVSVSSSNSHKSSLAFPPSSVLPPAKIYRCIVLSITKEWRPSLTCYEDGISNGHTLCKHQSCWQRSDRSPLASRKHLRAVKVVNPIRCSSGHKKNLQKIMNKELFAYYVISFCRY